VDEIAAQASDICQQIAAFKQTDIRVGTICDDAAQGVPIFARLPEWELAGEIFQIVVMIRQQGDAEDRSFKIASRYGIDQVGDSL
jgi:hypothetical protein